MFSRERAVEASMDPSELVIGDEDRFIVNHGDDDDDPLEEKLGCKKSLAYPFMYCHIRNSRHSD